MSLDFRKAEFAFGVASESQFPADGLPQVAFAGRSNVGKSSLLNALAGAKKLVKTSATPGKTRELNFFRVDGRMHLVDFPGFGYAKMPKTERARIGRLIDAFVAKSEALRGIVYLVDLRTEATALDVQMVSALARSGTPMLVVGTKADKIGKVAREKSLRTIAEKLGLDELPHWTSSSSGEGVQELRDALEALADED